MDSKSIIDIVVVFILLGLSAFFSSAETAFTTVNAIRIRSLIDDGNKRAKTVADIIEHSGKMLSAILIGNNIVNISVSALVTTLTIRIWGDFATGIATGVLTVLVLIFGEITPKTAASVHSEKIALLYAPIVRFLMIILTPVIFVIDWLAGLVMKIFHIDLKSRKQKITEDELRTFVKVSHEDGVIEKEERQIITNVFDFGDSLAKDVMIPRIDMTLANINASYNEIIQLFRETQYTRIPIYEDQPDNVVGILNIKDLILNTSDAVFHIADIMRNPFFTFEQKNTSDLFKEMQYNSTSVAIVLDEYGVASGMITTEDLLEEIVGEIRDEYDEDEKAPFTKINEDTYVVEGSYKLDDLNDLLQTSFESEDNDSVAGLIIEHLDRMPEVGDSIEIDGYRMKVEHVSSNRVEDVKIEKINRVIED